MRTIFVFLILVTTIHLSAQVNHADSLGTFNKTEDSDAFLLIVDQFPKFPGGDEAWNLFLQKNLKYPTMAREMGVQGKVYATFIVEKDGSITNIQIKQGLNIECDHEVLRVLRLMPKWEPGMDKERVVRVQFQIPISFKLK